MLGLEDEANSLLSLQEKATAEELEALVKRLNVETALLSVEDGRLVMNDLKRKSFLFKQELRKCYRSGVTLKAAYGRSERLQVQDEILWKEFDVKLSHIVKVGYQDLLKDYIETQDETLLLEYPEFKQITQYLTTKEMASCKWKKETML